MTTEYKPPAKLTPERLTTLAVAHRMYEQARQVLAAPSSIGEISSMATELKAAREALRAFVEAWEKSLQLKKTDHALHLAMAALEGIPEEEATHGTK